MANKRMLAQMVVESDAFYTLSNRAQLLYFHINMTADDDGFADRVLMTARMLGGGIDDIKELVASDFLIEFKNPTTYLIRHWRVNNNKIQGDRYKASIHQKFLSMVEIDASNVYQVKKESLQSQMTYQSLTDCDKALTAGSTKNIQNVNENAKSVNKLLTSCEQPVNKPLTQNRLDKSREDKNNTTAIYTSVNSNTGADKGVTGENADKSRFLDPTSCHDDNTDSGKSNTTDTKNIDMTHFSNQAIGDNQLTYPTLTDDKLRQIVRNNDRDLNESYVFLVNQGCDMNDDLKKRLREAVDIEKEIYKKSKSNNAT